MGIKISNTKSAKTRSSSFDISEVLTREITLFGKSFNNKKKEQWYSELSVLLTSGINLKSGLELLAQTQKKDKDKELMNDMLHSLVDGSSFSKILLENKNFSDYEFHAVKIGEQTGQLDQITAELSDFYKRKNDLKRQIVSALTYPIIVLCTALLVIFFMLKYVVPMFVDIFKQNNVELPDITKGIISFSNFVSTNSLVIVLVFLSLPFIYIYVSKKEWFRKHFGNFQLKIPILGNYFRQIYLAQFTQALSLLTSAKVPMVDSINLVKDMIDFYPLQKALETTNRSVINGSKLSVAFAQNSIFDKKMIAMIKVAEETNQTEFIFNKLNDQYNQQVTYQSQIISNTLNPFLTLIVGLIVGVILIAMYLPMFRLSSVIG